jgi:hypothetical protein
MITVIQQLIALLIEDPPVPYAQISTRLGQQAGVPAVDCARWPAG